MNVLTEVKDLTRCDKSLSAKVIYQIFRLQKTEVSLLLIVKIFYRHYSASVGCCYRSYSHVLQFITGNYCALFSLFLPWTKMLEEYAVLWFGCH